MDQWQGREAGVAGVSSVSMLEQEPDDMRMWV